MNFLLALAAITVLPALSSRTVRVLMGLLARLIAMAFVMALAIILLLALATHGRPI